MERMTRVVGKSRRLVWALSVCGALAACDESGQFALGTPQETGSDAAPTTGQSTKLVERDVEAPDVFQVTEAGLWDGRPSLGGVWVAHPEVGEPERVIIRNTANDKFVIGALFRRERNIPGPRLQASSDAAAALGMLAGAPVQLNVTALRREAVEPEKPAEPEEPATEEPAEEVVEEPAEEVVEETPKVEPNPVRPPSLRPVRKPVVEIEETALDPIAGAAAAAIEASAVAADAAGASATPEPARSASGSLRKPFIQIGIFNVEANANRTADQMRAAGMVPRVLQQTANDKPFWRVLVGPARNRAERKALMAQIKETGFTDAYPVTN